MKHDLIVRLHSAFEGIVQQDQSRGTEYWLARDLQVVLEYKTWENFSKDIEKAVTSCKQAGSDPDDHFLGVTKMVDIGSGAQREVVHFESDPPNA